MDTRKKTENNRYRSPQGGDAKEVLERETESQRPLLKKNFVLMAIAGAMIVLGFLLMVGSSSEWGEFNPDIFSTRRIVVGPTIAFLGFIFMGFGIMYSPKEKDLK